MIKFAVLSFPGSNCEAETVRAFRRNGMEAEVVLWNDGGILDGSRLDEFDGYVLVGGFSYEDRGRSGVVAAQDPITQTLKAEADKGKVVLGICNGAQILVEMGMIPGFSDKTLGMALAWNEMKQGDTLVDTGFYNAWAYLKNTAPHSRSAFNDFDDLLHIPFAHGEGRFMADEALLKRLNDNHQILFRYCDSTGRVDAHYPITPNGAMESIAGLCNPAGNVMAIMPHPERDPKGNGTPIFRSIKNWIETRRKTEFMPLEKGPSKTDIRSSEPLDLEIFIRLIITDNTERTIEEALIRKGMKTRLNRFEYFGLRLKEGVDAKKTLSSIMATGELANFNKHHVYVRLYGETFSFSPEKGLVPKALSLAPFVIVSDQTDFVGESKKSALNLHSGSLIDGLHYGVLWHFEETSEKTVAEIIDSKVLYNPYSMYLVK